MAVAARRYSVAQNAAVKGALGAGRTARQVVEAAARGELREPGSTIPLAPFAYNLASAQRHATRARADAARIDVSTISPRDELETMAAELIVLARENLTRAKLRRGGVDSAELRDLADTLGHVERATRPLRKPAAPTPNTNGNGDQEQAPERDQLADWAEQAAAAP